MTCSRYVHIAIFAISAVLASSRSYAQTDVGPQTTSGGYVNLQTSRNLFAVPNDKTMIRQYLADTQLSDHVFYVSRDEASGYQSSVVGRQRSTGRKVVGGIIGGVGGFFGGAYLGAAIEGDRCNCDDPGFVGFLIGAPIGAAVGAILGVKFF